jgi:hypothetical protein
VCVCGISPYNMRFIFFFSPVQTPSEKVGHGDESNRESDEKSGGRDRRPSADAAENRVGGSAGSARTSWRRTSWWGASWRRTDWWGASWRRTIWRRWRTRNRNRTLAGSKSIVAAASKERSVAIALKADASRLTPAAERIARARQTRTMIVAGLDQTCLEEPLGAVGGIATRTEGISGQAFTRAFAPAAAGFDDTVRT